MTGHEHEPDPSSDTERLLREIARHICIPRELVDEMEAPSNYSSMREEHDDLLRIFKRLGF